MMRAGRVAMVSMQMQCAAVWCGAVPEEIYPLPISGSGPIWLTHAHARVSDRPLSWCNNLCHQLTEQSYDFQSAIWKKKDTETTKTKIEWRGARPRPLFHSPVVYRRLCVRSENQLSIVSRKWNLQINASHERLRWQWCWAVHLRSEGRW